VPRILVIDDDHGVRDSMARMLRGAGYTVETAQSGEDGVAAAKGNAFDVILSDMRMPGISGLDVLTRLRDVRVDSAFIVMTGFGTIDTAVEAMKLGAVDFVQKPFLRDELLMRVKSAADRRQLARQVDLLQRQIRGSSPLDALVGDSEPMVKVKDLIGRAAAAPGTVLITGETGTGKELVARAIHAGSPRAERTFVALNCAALTDSLLENELFGHARGAFTGAIGPRAGLFEEAHGGTLFLDEVAELSARAQAKLLRALQEREVRRLGENQARRVDVRIVAATNSPLAEAAASGRFREDLLFRLAVARIRMPALADRLEDLPLLAFAFWRRAAQEAGTRAVLGADAIAALCRHGWPGNVRELQNVMAAVALGAPSRGRVTPRQVTLAIGAASPAADAPPQSLGRAVNHFERRTIAAALARHGGRRAAAARELGISRQGLAKAMRRVGLVMAPRRAGVA
jgi:two-component system response regulator HydG